MTIQEQLLDRVKSLEEQHKDMVKSIYTHEIELGIEKNQKRLIEKQIHGCKADMAKIEGNNQ